MRKIDEFNVFLAVSMRAFSVLAIISVILTAMSVTRNINDLKETINSIKPVDDCAWLYVDGKRGAAIYNRFDGTITIQCKGGEE